ncbi:toxin-antitoxin system YwqK family antitoxin [Sphingomonas sp. ac-8]|uniref:toxin-antitoxin system YwqK family antitoxin n=1 Tax=Sphingomonas sp. ac-8 TaxID=3242977 RepID=UPI003A8125B7
MVFERLLFSPEVGPVLVALASPVSAAPRDTVVLEEHEQVAEADLCHLPGRPSYGGFVELRRADGSLMRQVACEGGEKHGRDRQFHTNGTLAMERHWKRGDLDGRYRRWYRDGTLQEEWTYGPHGLEGEYRVYHSNGRPASIAHWRDGKRDGPYINYDKAGHVLEVGRYAAGRADGEVIEYLPSGRARKHARFAMGHRVGVQALWGSNGQLLRRTEYTPEGRFVQRHVWNVDGTLRRVTRPISIPGYGRGLKMVRHEGCLTETVIQSGTDDPARLAEIGYSFTPGLYKLETVRRGDEVVERVEAYDHQLIAPVIRKDRQC